METLKKVLSVVAIVSIAALTALGVTEAGIGTLTTVGIGAGGIVALLIGLLLKKS